ncbi:hypothetical protein GCK32_012427 [Trichostrongylus colubriformis]|uniref:Uncharacterized protein n=1 Tax=Trichostrongylus colubriformis TaxID=6319 RepID=A0AAN8EWL9_TRICO
MHMDDRQWITDRLGGYCNYVQHSETARSRMGRLFSVVTAALAAQETLMEERATNYVVTRVRNVYAIPIRLCFTLTMMSSEGGWDRPRPVDVWIVNSTKVKRTRIARTEFVMVNRQINVELVTEPCHHETLRPLIRRHGIHRDSSGTAKLAVCLCLGRAETGKNPVSEPLANEVFADALRRPTADVILDMD